MRRSLTAELTGWHIYRRWHIYQLCVDNRVIRSSLVVAATLLLAVACQNGKDGDVDSALAQLRQRPSIEQTVHTYQEMIGQMRRELDAAFGPRTWETRGELGGAGCTDFPGAGGKTRSLADSYFEGNLPDAGWTRAVEIVAGVGRKYGFGDPVTVVDRPSDHEVTAQDAYGGTYVFGTAANTILTGRTGCHLPAAELAKPPPS
jgi:Lipoprotein confined to pathogenic Mycobacterium